MLCWEKTSLPGFFEWGVFQICPSIYPEVFVNEISFVRSKETVNDLAEDKQGKKCEKKSTLKRYSVLLF